MSIQENVEFLKKEISTEEKFFEGFFKLEKVWQSYKLVLIGAAVLILGGFIGTNVMSYLELQNKTKANIAFNTLLTDTTNASAIATLKETNPQLLTIANHITSGQEKIINVEYLKEIAQFNQAMNTNNLDAISKTTLNSKFLLKEYALFQKALIQAINNNYADAKETLKLIPAKSSVSRLSNQLNHYLLTK